jgi:hypothetical protein
MKREKNLPVEEDIKTFKEPEIAKYEFFWCI